MDADESTESEASDHAATGFEKEKTNEVKPDSAEEQQIPWSDEEDPGAAYERFKKAKSLKRKRDKTSSTKGKSRARKKKKSGESSESEEHAKAPGQGADTLSDASGEDRGIPDYLQQRRSVFDKEREKFKAAGLKVPPTYDSLQFSDDERMDELEEKPRFPGSKPPGAYKDYPIRNSLGLIPASIAQWLREYQFQGSAFLHRLFVHQTGGILGDDMGLGKTIQVIAFLTAAFGKTGDERDAKRMRKMRRKTTLSWYPRVLIVCPGTLIENWKSEFQRWGWWHVDVYHGATKEAVIQAAAAGRLEIMITTYSTYRNSKDVINCIEWDCVVADECHQIKGRTSGTTLAMNEVNALCRIGLTGTAIQNDYQELWTLLNWTNPGRFGPAIQWKNEIGNPLKFGQSHDATVHQLGKARRTAKLLVEKLLPKYFLRRMKSLIAHQLPKKRDRVVFCPLTPTQATAYRSLVESDLISYIWHSSDECECGSGKKAGWCCNREIPGIGPWQNVVFPAMSNLQKLSNHIALMIPKGLDTNEKLERDLEMLKAALPNQWREVYRSSDSLVNYSNAEYCGKWIVLNKLLRFWHETHDKVLVFSHSVRLLNMLRLLFQSTAYNVSYLDGKMSYEDRVREVNDFNGDPEQFVFLISTKAGGTGLNITSANKVVIMDPNWNPAHDLQAQDRAYRIGQTRDVEVFRLISTGTIEEIVYARQIYKQQQANIAYTASNERRYFKGIKDSNTQKGEIFGLRNLFAYSGDQLVLRGIVNKTEVAESRAGVSVMDIDLLDTQDSSSSSKTTSQQQLNAAEGDDAMSQLAAIVAAGNADPLDSEEAPKAPRKSRIPSANDPVQAILASAGVEYTHENSEVIGSSKIETHLSRRAEEAAALDPDAGKHVFVNTQEHIVADDGSNKQRDASLEGSETEPGSEGNEEDEESPVMEETPEFYYNPPPEVMKRQFCTMAQTFGFTDVVDFALVVEGWPTAQRRDCLESFYRQRRDKLGLLTRRT